MFTQLIRSLTGALDQHLSGWEVKTFKFWVNEQGVEYAEARIAVADDVLRVRLKGEGDTIRLVDVELHKGQLRPERQVSVEKPKGSRPQ